MRQHQYQGPDFAKLREAQSGDWPGILALLREHGLPIDGAREHLAGFLVAEVDGWIIGCAGLERYGAFGLLRSVAVSSDAGRRGMGSALVRQLLRDARASSVRDLYLLTTTASEWFPRFGFSVIPRNSLPGVLEDSEELRGACPGTAVTMKLALSPEEAPRLR